jgi:hypothetical protein
VWLASERGQCGGDFGEGGADVGGGGAGVAVAVGVSGVGAGDGVAVVSFHPGQGGVPEPVGADLLGGDPRQVLADAVPEVVVAAGGDRAAVEVAQELPGGGGAALGGVLE